MKNKLLFNLLTPFATSNTEGKTFRNLLALFMVLLGMGFSWGQTTLPVSRTTWESAPTGWTDVMGTYYNSSFACSGSNGGKFEASSQSTKVNFTGVPNQLSFTVKSNSTSSTSTLAIEQSSDNTNWTTVTTVLTGNSGLPSSCTSKGPYSLLTTSRYVRLSFTKGSSNMTIDDVSITAAASSNSTASDIITQSGYSYTSNIDYASKQTASSLTIANSVGVNGLTLRDGGVTTDTDALGTTLTDVTFSTGGSTAIRTAALFDGTNKIAEVAVNGATSIVFSGLSLSATDGGTKDFELRVTYQSSVTDNQQIIYTVSSATASASTSSFATANAGAAASSATGDNNRIEVTVSVLVFSQQPTDVNTNVSMSPAVTVTAKDTNNNNDLDFTDTIRVSSTGTMTGSPVSVAAVNGVATFSSLTHTNTGTGLTLLAERNNSGSWDLDVTSNPFSVAVVSTATDYFRSLATGSWASPSSWESSSDNINWINATLTPTSNANVISIRNGHTVTINASVTVDEVIVLSGGTLNASAVMTVNNGSGDDITVESGGRVNYTVAPVYSSSVIRIKTGGIVSVQVSGMTSVGTGVNASTHVYEDGSILEWNLASGTPSASGVTYFPNVITEIPIFRFAVAPNGNLGGSNPTVINGRVELASGVSISWSGNGTKTFRNGVVGLGGLNTMSTASGTGVWNISGTTAQLGTNGGTSLTLSNTNGIAISGATTATVVGNLNIGTTTNLTVAASGTLNTGGFLTFKSDANGTASLGNSAGTISGNVTVERYIPARRAYRFLSPAVTTSTTIRQNWQENGGTAAGLGTHITGTGGATNGFDPTETNNSSLLLFTNGAWVGATSTNVSLTAGNAYCLMVRGDRTTDLTTNTPATSNTVLRATGTLFTGNFSPVLSAAASGYSFIGNPYQAPLDIKTALQSSTDVNKNVVYYWDPTINARGGYITRNLQTSQNSPSSSVNDYVQPGQAFFVVNEPTLTSTPALTFTENHKSVVNAAAGVFRTANTNEYGTLRVNLQANTNNQWATIDGALAIFNDAFSWNVTSEDATKMANLDEDVSFVQNNTNLAIALQSNPSATSELPIKIDKMRHTNYQWKFELDNYNGATPYLFDTLNNSYTQINNGTAVPFTADSTTTNRFKVVFQNAVLSNATFEKTLAIYPNPAKAGASFYVEGISEATVTVSNLLGQTVPVQTKSQGTTLQVTPKTSLSQGVYLVNITTQGTTQQVKWIVE